MVGLGPHQHAAAVGPLGRLGGQGHRRPGRVVGQLHRGQHPLAPHLGHQGAGGQLADPALQVGAHRLGVGHQALPLDDGDHLQPGRAGGGVARVGVAVHQLDGPAGVHELRVDPLRGHRRPHRHIRRGEALGRGHDVGHYPVAMAAEPVPQAAPAAHHLVEDQQHLGRVAQLPHLAQIGLGRGMHAARGLHRLHYHRGHRSRVPALQLGRQGVDVMGGDLAAPGHQRTEAGPVLVQPAHRQPAEVHPVIGPVQRDEPGLVGQAPALPVGPGHLERGLHRLRARVGEEDVVQVARRALRHRPGKPLGRLVAVAEQAVVLQRRELALHRLGDLGPAVAHDGAGHSARGGVQQAAALRVDDLDALALGQPAGRRPPGRGERQPQPPFGAGAGHRRESRHSIRPASSSIR